MAQPSELQRLLALRWAPPGQARPHSQTPAERLELRWLPLKGPMADVGVMSTGQRPSFPI